MHIGIINQLGIYSNQYQEQLEQSQLEIYSSLKTKFLLNPSLVVSSYFLIYFLIVIFFNTNMTILMSALKQNVVLFEISSNPPISHSYLRELKLYSLLKLILVWLFLAHPLGLTNLLEVGFGKLIAISQNLVQCRFVPGLLLNWFYLRQILALYKSTHVFSLLICIQKRSMALNRFAICFPVLVYVDDSFQFVSQLNFGCVFRFNFLFNAWHSDLRLKLQILLNI